MKSKEVNNVSLFLNSDTARIAVPTLIKPVSNGLLTYDAGKHQVTKLNNEGHHVFSFGSKGRGPGEFQSVGGFWKFDNSFLVYDINGKKLSSYDLRGNHIKDNPLNFVEFPGGPVGIEAISPQKFIMPAAGKQGKLLRLIDIQSEQVQYFGKAVSEEYVPTQSSEDVRRAILAGNIPAMYKNKVMLGSNKTGIFSFQQATAVLEKYSHSGELLWSKNLKVPAIDGLFEQILAENKERIDQDEFLLSFSYSAGLSTNEKGAAILLNVSNDQPTTVVWVPNDGHKITVVRFMDVMESSELGLNFSVGYHGNDVFFVNFQRGKIYKAEWPI
ncbi:MAG: 6-bladed beta-propeller [Fodinibius sp.]|nr:6-bladed beta-propeller [Fodinibius sp.]